MNSIVNVSGYKFIRLTELEILQMDMQANLANLNLKGTVLLSQEGINLNLAGSRESIDGFYQYIQNYSVMNGIFYKESVSDFVPFNKLAVKIKKEIITFNQNDLSTAQNSKHTLSPKALKQWLDEGKPVLLLDTRNDYEVAIGTFANAMEFDIQHFTQLPENIAKLPEHAKDIPVVMFCTGGVRCEKVIPLFLEKGYENVYQLEGGILNYFQECGSAHYNGECFVFDNRVSLDTNLQVTGTTLCGQCQFPVTKEEQQLPSYVVNQSCLHCAID